MCYFFYEEDFPARQGYLHGKIDFCVEDCLASLDSHFSRDFHS